MALDGIDRDLAEQANHAVAKALAEETPTIGRLLSITREKKEDGRLDFIDIDGFEGMVQIVHRVVYTRREEDQGHGD